MLTLSPFRSHIFCSDQTKRCYLDLQGKLATNYPKICCRAAGAFCGAAPQADVSHTTYLSYCSLSSILWGWNTAARGGAPSHAVGMSDADARPWRTRPPPLTPTFGALRNEPCLCVSTPMVRRHQPPSELLFQAPPPADPFAANASSSSVAMADRDALTPAARRTSSGEGRTVAADMLKDVAALLCGHRLLHGPLTPEAGRTRGRDRGSVAPSPPFVARHRRCARLSRQRCSARSRRTPR